MDAAVTKNPNTEEDTAAIERCLAGDSSGFNYLQKKYKSIVTSLVRKMLKNEEDVEDLVQDTFIKAYNALKSFQFNYSFAAWLYRIASNGCIDFLRKKKYQVVSLNVKYNDSSEEEEMDIYDDSYMPDIKILNEEKRKILNEAFEKLPENYKKILKLRHEEDLDYNEISAKLELPLGTVKAHLFRARKLMYDHLKNNKHLFVQ